MIYIKPGQAYRNSFFKCSSCPLIWAQGPEHWPDRERIWMRPIYPVRTRRQQAGSFNQLMFYTIQDQEGFKERLRCHIASDIIKRIFP